MVHLLKIGPVITFRKLLLEFGEKSLFIGQIFF